MLTHPKLTRVSCARSTRSNSSFGTSPFPIQAQQPQSPLTSASSSCRIPTGIASRFVFDDAGTAPTDQVHGSCDKLTGFEDGVRHNRNNRTQQRIAASLAGIKELDILRQKHRRMVEEVKMHLSTSYQFRPMEPSTQEEDSAAKFNINRTPGDSDGHRLLTPHEEIQGPPRAPSPPSTDTSSHRSSLSIDSGCISLNSENSNRNALITNELKQGPIYGQLSQRYPQWRQPPKQDPSNAPMIPMRKPAIISDDEGWESDTRGSIHQNKCYRILNVESTPPASPWRQPSGPSQRRSNKMCRNRPKSLSGYPEGNTVLVPQNPRPHDAIPLLRYGSMRGHDGLLRSIAMQYPELLGPEVPPEVFTYPPVPPERLVSDSMAMLRGPQVINRAPINQSDMTFRASPIYVQPIRNQPVPQPRHRRGTPSSTLARDSHASMRPHSMAFPPTSSCASFHSPSPAPATTTKPFTWDDVKRALDPGYDRRRLSRQSSAGSSLTVISYKSDQSPKIRKTPSNHSSQGTVHSDIDKATSSNASIPQCVTSSVTTSRSNPQSPAGVKRRCLSHSSVTRTMSSQSSDSNRSRRSRAEKQWHESDEL